MTKQSQGQHTPGPWFVDVDPVMVTIPRADMAEPEAICYAIRCLPPWSDVADEQDYANARLIAAAPDLLQVAEGALGYLRALPREMQPDPWWYAPLEAAIAKARGEDRP